MCGDSRSVILVFREGKELHDITIAIFLSVCQVLAPVRYVSAALTVRVCGLEASVVSWKC